MAIPKTLRQIVAERDNHRCAYCLTSEENCGLRMHIDHVVPEAAGGQTTEDNMCLACFSCNAFKWAKQIGKDPVSKEDVSLFHPLRQQWSDHFTWDDSRTQIIGRTACGRATIETLQMNNPTRNLSMDMVAAASLEQWLSRIVSDPYLEERAARSTGEAFSQALAQVPDVPPEAYDRL